MARGFSACRIDGTDEEEALPENLKTGLDEGAESLGEALEAETRNAQVKEAFDDGRYEKRKPEFKGR